ncbi:MAG: hypothetical protein R2712_03335 [Vicinamibacterales bacterium]
MEHLHPNPAPRAGRRRRLAAIAVLAAACVLAQTGATMKTGLHTFPLDHTARLTVVELGQPLSTSRGS